MCQVSTLAQAPPNMAAKEITPPKNIYPAYMDGETLDFNVYYKTGIFWFNVGEMQLKSDVAGEEIMLTLTARTYPKWRKIQNIDINMLSHSKANEAYPYAFTRHAFENNATVFDSVNFHQELLKVDQYLGQSKDSAQLFELEIKDKVYDVISFLYSCRFLPYDSMEAGEKIPRRLYYNKKAYDLSLDYNGQKEKKVKKLGKYQSHHIQIKTIEGIHFKPTDFMQIWLSTEAGHRPLVFETPMKMGSLRMVAKR